MPKVCRECLGKNRGRFGDLCREPVEPAGECAVCLRAGLPVQPQRSSFGGVFYVPFDCPGCPRPNGYLAPHDHAETCPVRVRAERAAFDAWESAREAEKRTATISAAECRELVALVGVAYGRDPLDLLPAVGAATRGALVKVYVAAGIDVGAFAPEADL